MFVPFIIITMGNATSPYPCQPTTIGNAYLAKVLQGVKREVDSHVEIQCLSSREMYDQWKMNIHSYKQRIEEMFPNDASIICNSLLFPSSTRYEENNNICGDKHGKVVLQFSSGFLNLEESKSLHIQENMPYTSSEIWNLLFCMVQYSLLIKRTSLPLDIRSETIYTDLRTKNIRLKNPFSFLGMDLKYKHQKYIDTQKIELVIRGFKIPKEIQEQNEAFNIGMTLVEVMLLEHSCKIYDDGLSSHRRINPELHEIIVEKILKIVYYPLKLRIIVAGLIQLNSKDRFTCEQIFALLKDSKEKIKNGNIFHLRKTAFLSIFRQKMTAIEASIGRVKHQSHSEMFKDGVPFSFYSEDKTNKHFPAFNSSHNKQTYRCDAPPDNMNDSLNFSITHIAHTNRNVDHQSLMLSKSENKSSVFQEKQGAKERSILSSEHVKNSQKSALSLQMTVPTPPSGMKKVTSIDKSSQTPEQNESVPPPQLSRIPDEDITDPFDNFQGQKQKSKQQDISKLSSISKKTPPRNSIQDKSQRQSNSLKVQEGSVPIKQLITPDPRLSANLELIETQKKISVEAGKQNQHEDISYISHDKDRSHNSHSRNSSVVQYVSQLYETQRAPADQQLQATRTEHMIEGKEGLAEARKSNQSQGDRLFYSFQPQRLFIRKTQSYQIPSMNSRTSIEYPPPKEVAHQGSIIDKLAPLVKSRKGPSEDYKPENLTDSARKRIDYWNTFSKYSPEVIAQLHLPTRYPQSERLKRSMRQTISYHNIAMSRTKKMFPEGETQSVQSEPKINTQ